MRQELIAQHFTAARAAATPAEMEAALTSARALITVILAALAVVTLYNSAAASGCDHLPRHWARLG